MSFEFVHNTPNQQRHNEDTRRRIRSQVMRNYRNRSRRDTSRVVSRAASSSRSRDRSQELPESSDRSPEGPADALSGRRDDSSGRSSAASALDEISHEDTLEIRRTRGAYRNWLTAYSTRRSQSRMNIVDAPWRTATTPLLTFALFLEASGQLRSLNARASPSRGEMETRVKIKVLALLRERINDSELVLEDETLAALGYLVNYEMSYRSDEASVHLNAITEILRLRRARGLAVQQPSGLSIFLETIDLLYAIAFNTGTLYSKRTPNPGNTTPEEDAGESDSTSEAELEQDDWLQLLLNGWNSVTSEYHGEALVQTLTLAADLHLMTSSDIQPSPATLEFRCNELHHMLSNMPEESWGDDEMLHLIVLLTGLSDCVNPVQKSWYFAHLTRMLYYTRLEEWPSTRDLLLRFIDMQIQHLH